MGERQKQMELQQDLMAQDHLNEVMRERRRAEEQLEAERAQNRA